MDQLLPLLLPFVNRQAADVPPAWEKPLRKSVWAVLGSLVSRCTLNESQQRMLVDLAEKAIADPADAADLASNIHDATVFSVLVKLSPKSERLVPTLLKLEAEPRTGVAKAFHTEWTISLLAYLAKQEPKALQALIRLLEDNALDEETRFDAKGGGKASFARSPRAYAIRELGRLGPAARDALPVLKKQLESKNKAVVTAAEKAIQQIETAKDDTKTD